MGPFKGKIENLGFVPGSQNTFYEIPSSYAYKSVFIKDIFISNVCWKFEVNMNRMCLFRVRCFAKLTPPVLAEFRAIKSKKKTKDSYVKFGTIVANS